MAEGDVARREVDNLERIAAGLPSRPTEPRDDVEMMAYWAQRIIDICEEGDIPSAGMSHDLDRAHDELTRAARSYLGLEDA